MKQGSQYSTDSNEGEVLLQVSCSVEKVLEVGLTCASQSCRLESPPAWSKSEIALKTKLHTTLSSSLAVMLSYKKSRHSCVR